MSNGRVDQLLAGFTDGDAISREARLLQSILRAQGFSSNIYAPARHTSPTMMDKTLPLSAYDGKGDDTLVYHYSTTSPATELYQSAQSRRILRYHNITPGRYFFPWDEPLAEQLDAARKALPSLAGDEAWAVSAYNADELIQSGFRNVKVVSLFHEIESIQEPDPEMLAKLTRDIKQILFVGRLTPNKAIEELIETFAWYHRRIEPQSRLVLAGSDRSCPRYYARLRFLADRLGLKNVVFTGFVTEAQLAACYQSAHLFCCMSRHEGYCLPLVEALQHQIPVLARDTGGMPEALGSGGVLFDDLSKPVLAELFHELISEGPLRQSVLRSAQTRLEELQARNPAQELTELLGSRL